MGWKSHSHCRRCCPKQRGREKYSGFFPTKILPVSCWFCLPLVKLGQNTGDQENWLMKFEGIISRQHSAEQRSAGNGRENKRTNEYKTTPRMTC
jgi:hypothetical protein